MPQQAKTETLPTDTHGHTINDWLVALAYLAAETGDATIYYAAQNSTTDRKRKYPAYETARANNLKPSPFLTGVMRPVASDQDKLLQGSCIVANMAMFELYAPETAEYIARRLMETHPKKLHGRFYLAASLILQSEDRSLEALQEAHRVVLAEKSVNSDPRPISVDLFRLAEQNRIYASGIYAQGMQAAERMLEAMPDCAPVRENYNKLCTMFNNERHGRYMILKCIMTLPDGSLNPDLLPSQPGLNIK